MVIIIIGWYWTGTIENERFSCLSNQLSTRNWELSSAEHGQCNNKQMISILMWENFIRCTLTHTHIILSIKTPLEEQGKVNLPYFTKQQLQWIRMLFNCNLSFVLQDKEYIKSVCQYARIFKKKKKWFKSTYKN